MLFLLHRLLLVVLISASASVAAQPANDDKTRFIGERGGNSLVVFVHGIGGTADSTWGAPGKSWPDLVKKDTEFFGGFDVLVYDYPSAIFGQSQPVAQLGRRLRDRLSRDDVKISQYENVVFVTHSLGGIVVREYILDNLENSTNVLGVFAFAAPMDGSHLANIASTFGRSDTIVELRNSTSAEGYVSKLIDRWIGKRPAIPIRNWCGYETKPLFGLLGEYISYFISLKVVTPGSARHLCGADSHPIPGDHWSIVKPQNITDYAHDRIRAWIVDAMARAQPAVVEKDGDIVFANCADSPYGVATQTEMFRIAEEIAPKTRVRLSRRLPVEYSATVRSLLWHKAKPSMLIIHLSCFQNGPETAANAATRTEAFHSLLTRLKRDQIKILVYSRAFVARPNFRREYLPKHLDTHYGSRAVYLPYNSNIIMTENPEGQQFFRQAFDSLLNDKSAWPNLP